MKLTPPQIGNMSLDWGTARGELGEQIEQLTTNINAGWRKQHNTDGSHNNIIATGSISEHSRKVPMGEWINPTLNPGVFTVVGAGNTWTNVIGVASGTQYPLSYTIIGKTMILNVAVVNSVLTLPTATSTLVIAIPDGYISKANEVYPFFGRTTVGFCEASDGAGNIAAFLRVGSGASTIDVVKTTHANWSAYSNTHILGQITFEIEG
jgi:hypothetical protein